VGGRTAQLECIDEFVKSLLEGEALRQRKLRFLERKKKGEPICALCNSRWHCNEW
jgi:hypothetical protein